MFTFRNLIRLILFIACALLALGLVPDAWQRGSVLLPALSPLLGVGGALAARSAGVMALLGLPLLILPLFKGRYFCWRLCPMGFAAETVSRLNRRNAGLIRKIPFIGKGAALVILGSAAIGYPVLIWTDPLCIFNGFFAAWRQPLAWLSAATAGGFVLILLASLIVPNIWCHRLCPLGGLEEWLTQLAKTWNTRRPRPDSERPGVKVNTPLDVKAGRRVFLGFALGGFSGLLYRTLGSAAAPATVDDAYASSERHGGRSKGQGQGAGKGQGQGRGQGQGLGRGQGQGMGQGQGHSGHEECQNARQIVGIRPPGAADKAFNALCARCGNCMAACPYGLILPDLGSTGIDGFFTPVLAFRNRNGEQEEFCFQECTACTQVCPTGALSPLTIEQKQQTAIGLAHVCRHTCIAWAKQEYCVVCQEYCPYQAIIEVERGGVMCPIVDEAKCRGCGACESQCPAQPIAIVVNGRTPQPTLSAPSPQLSDRRRATRPPSA